MTPELRQQVAIWRAKVADGTFTLEDQIEATRVLRAGRLSAQVSSETKRRAVAKAEIRSADEMLDEIG